MFSVCCGRAEVRRGGLGNGGGGWDRNVAPESWFALFPWPLEGPTALLSWDCEDPLEVLVLLDFLLGFILDCGLVSP